MFKPVFGRLAVVLVAASLASSLGASLIAQASATLRVSVLLIDADLNVKPVPRHALTVKRADGKGDATRLVMGFDGRAEIRLEPGSYILESERPVEFQGHSYRWRYSVTVRPTGITAAELSVDNAIEEAAAPRPSAVAPPPPPVSAPPPPAVEPRAPARATESGPVGDAKKTTYGTTSIGGGVTIVSSTSAWIIVYDSDRIFGNKPQGLGLAFDATFSKPGGHYGTTVGIGPRFSAGTSNIHPFGHAMFGTGVIYAKGCGTSCTFLQLELGGGLDMKLSPRMGIHGQFDHQIIWQAGGSGHQERIWGGVTFFLAKSR